MVTTSKTPTRPTYIYRLDQDDRIISVNEAWKQFARENGAPELQENAVIGRVLWDFMGDRDTVLLHQLIVGKVRAHQKILSWSFRCDSADRYRIMESTVSPMDNGGIEYTNYFISEYPRAKISLIDPKASRTDEFLRLCSWCKGVIQGQHVVTLEYYDELLNQSTTGSIPRLNHGMCNDCYESQRTSIRNQA